MPQDIEYFKNALVGKKIPILTLDHQWHKLFTQSENYPAIHSLEEQVNDKLKRQGKINTELKSLSSYKKKLMKEIVDLMELPDSPEKTKKMDDNKRQIEETNANVENYQDELLSIPNEIDDLNFQLMIETMNVCYEKIQKNTQDIDAINKWVEEFRIKLKKQMVLKNRKELINNELYSYMHAIFGPEVIEVFDMKYNPNNVLNRCDNENNNEETPK